MHDDLWHLYYCSSHHNKNLPLLHIFLKDGNHTVLEKPVLVPVAAELPFQGMSQNQAPLLERVSSSLSGVFVEMQWSLLNSRMLKDEESKKQHFHIAWGLFLAIGVVGFGFTLDQIEQAYMEKNAVNHKRQQEGY